MLSRYICEKELEKTREKIDTILINKNSNKSKNSLVDDIKNLFSFLTYEKQEHVYLIILNSRYDIAGTVLISKGTLDQSLLYPRDVYREAIKHNAKNIILIHNHPSNNNDPSDADVKVTKDIKNAGDIVGIKLLNHYLITRKEDGTIVITDIE